MEAASEILDFWFALPKEAWWEGDAQLDASIRARFHDLWTKLRQCPADTFLGSANDALAAVILFDQFPRNMFRDDAESFATDALALTIAREAIERGLDGSLSPERRQFLYMPFQHSEALKDQQQSVALFTALGDPEPLRYAKLHHDVIDRFGRFPHRNAMLGRTPRQDEIDAGDVTPW